MLPSIFSPPFDVDEMANRLNDLAPSKVASFYLLFFIFREIFGALLIKNEQVKKKSTIKIPTLRIASNLITKPTLIIFHELTIEFKRCYV